MSMYCIWCLVGGDKTPFKVMIPVDKQIADLKDSIKERGIDATEHAILAKNLTIWKLREDISIDPHKTLADRIGNKFLEISQFAEELSPAVVVAEVWPEEPNSTYLHIVARLPSDCATSSRLVETRSQESIAFFPLINIMADNQGNFGGPSTIRDNEISELPPGPQPEFLLRFRAKLTQRRWIESDTDTNALALVLILKNKLHNFGDYFQESATNGEQSGCFSNSDQLLHFVNALSLKGWKNDDVINEYNIRWIFDEMEFHFRSVLGRRESHSYRCDWPFSLTVTVKSEDDKTFRYTPRSDFHISVDSLVHLIVEVQSERDERDRYRMLLQGACAARVGRKIYGRPFIVMAVYIRNSGIVTRYLLFQGGQSGDDTKVSYYYDIQFWTTRPSDLFNAIFEMYNLLSIIQSDAPELPDTRRTLRLLQSDIEATFKTTFSPPKRRRPDSGEGGTGPNKRSDMGRGGNTGNALRHGEHVYQDRQVVDAFTQAGYKLESYDDDEISFQPINKLKPTMRFAKQSGGASVVVKKLRSDSDELSILQYLHSFAPSHNYILPILTALELDVGMFIFVPEGIPLEIGFTFKIFSDKRADFSRQLIEGVAFLHRCDIAHLDIKPGNLVVFKNRLLIIDFDISVHVDGPDALIDHWCGTPGWMAPEIGHEDGPVCQYSPIRADLWSCGRMLEYLASKGVVQANWIKTLTKQLLNKNPRLRPLLGVQSSVTVAHPLSNGNGRLKRKLDALPHDVKRLAVLTGP